MNYCWYIELYRTFLLAWFVYFVVSHPLIAVCFLIFHLFLDALDGPLARISGNDNDSWAFTDILCDHTWLFVVVVALVWSHLVHPVVALIYMYVYTLLVVFLTVRNTIHMPINATVRPTYPIYLLYFLFAVWHINYLDLWLSIWTFLMIPSLVSSYFTIKLYLKWK